MLRFIKILLALLLSGQCYATNYYFSATGNDGNAGTSTGLPWQTIGKANSFAFVHGDSVFFNRGDVFYGQLIPHSGVLGDPVVYAAYGTGARPIISGLTAVTSWTNITGNIWESSTAVITPSLPQMNIVIINGVNYAMGRTPNTGYYNVDAATSNTSVTSTSLDASTTDWTDAEAVIRKVAWITDRNVITSASGSTINFTSPGSTTACAINWGFFIEDDPRTLDTLNEWYYNPSNGKLRIVSAGSPTDVQVSTIDTLCRLSNKNFVTFDHIRFKGSNKSTISISAQHVTFQYCAIDYNGTDGIRDEQANTSTFFVFKNSTINHSNSNATMMRTKFVGALWDHDTIKNTGLQEGMMTRTVNGDGIGRGIQLRADSAKAQYCEVDSSGYSGIFILFRYDTAQYNFVNYSLMTLGDGGSIYDPGEGAPSQTGVSIHDNICLYAIGPKAGTIFSSGTLQQGEGIYIDDLADSVDIYNNTVAFCNFSSLFIHSCKTIHVWNNTFYASGRVAEINSSNSSHTIRGLVLKNNLFVAKGSGDLPVYWSSQANDFSSFAVSTADVDSNIITRPINDASATIKSQFGSETSYNLTTWKSAFGYDTHSSVSPKSISDTSDFKFIYNVTEAPVVVSLGSFNYIDMQGANYPGTITLQPYTSAVLLKNGVLGNSFIKFYGNHKLKNF